MGLNKIKIIIDLSDKFKQWREDGYYYIDENGKKQRNDIQDYDDILGD